MRLTIRNILGCEYFSAEFNPGPVYVYGPNSSGKTSLATAIAAVAAHEANPLGLPSGSKKEYVTLGATEGSAGLDGARVTWTGDAIVCEGDQTPDASPHAVGLVDFTQPRRNQADRARCWEDLFLPPSPGDILRPDWPFSEVLLEQVLGQIDDEGWESTMKSYVEQGRHAKRKWREQTSEPYGAKKAKTWTPSQWRDELAGESEESLQGRLTEARDAKSRLIAVRAVSEEQVAKAREARDVEIPAFEAALEGLSENVRARLVILQERHDQVEATRAQLEELWQRYNRLKAIREAKPEHKCPVCEAGLVVGDGAVRTWVAPTSEQIEEATEQFDGVRLDGAALKKELGVWEDQGARARADYDVAASAVAEKRGELTVLKRLAADANKQVTAELDQAEVDRLSNIIDEANRDLIAWRRKREAAREAENVVYFEEIVRLLGPTGARASTMSTAMGGVRSIVTALCRGAGWVPVEIMRDYTLRCDGISVRTASENERLKAQWLCQIAAAWLKPSKWLILDRADLLKFENWDGLVRIVGVLAERMPATRVVVCASGDGSEAPDAWPKIDLAAEE